MKTGLLAGASRFAHFAGFTRSKPRAADDDDRQDDTGAEDDDKDPDASEDDDKPAGKSGRRARKAEDDDKDPDAEDDDKDPDASEDDDDKPAGKSGRRARKAEDDDKDPDVEDDDDDTEMKGNSASAKARRREQARITHILTSKAAVRNPALAVALACTTRMTRQEAVAVLRDTPAAQGDDSGNRHARTDRQDRNPKLGTDSQPLKGEQAINASWDGAFKKAGVKVR